MKKLLIALTLLVVSIPATPIQKDFEKRPVVLDRYEWVTVWNPNSHTPWPAQPIDATIVTFIKNEKRLFWGFISFRYLNLHDAKRGYLIREDGRELFCLNSGGCWPVWDRTAR